MPRIVLLSLGLMIGAVLPIQAAMNARVRLVVGSPFRAALVSVVVSSLALFVIVLLNQSEPIATRQSAWWIWLGGLLGAAYVTGSLVLAPRLGATTLVAAIVAGQLTVAVLLDHFGVLGYPIVPASWRRMIGVVLLFIGVLLIQRR